ncbi:MAG: hypothetical protein H7068_10990 [Pedobacter sp.]|nr:hypothetical protein [Chitinophagaceae bacterium]
MAKLCGFDSRCPQQLQIQKGEQVSGSVFLVLWCVFEILVWLLFIPSSASAQGKQANASM